MGIMKSYCTRATVAAFVAFSNAYSYGMIIPRTENGISRSPSCTINGAMGTATTASSGPRVPAFSTSVRTLCRKHSAIPMFAARRQQTGGRRKNSNVRGGPNPAILNKQIIDLGRKQNWNEILLFYKREREYFNNVNFATTISQLGRIRNVNRMDQLFISFLDDLANQLEERGMEAMGVRQIANIVHAIGKMHLKNACTRRIIMYVARPDNASWVVTAAVKEDNPQAVANIAWAFAKLGIKSTGFFSELEMNHSKWLLTKGNPQAAANTAWAYATLEIEAPKILSELDRSAEKIVNEGYPQAVANTAWACAKLGTQAPNLFSAIDNRAEWLVKEGNPQAVANTVWACATLGVVLPKLFDEVEKSSSKLVASGSPQAITNTAWAFGKLGVKTNRFFAEIDNHAQRIVKDGNVLDIANTVWACATLQIKTPKLFAQVEKHSTRFVKESDSQAVANTVWALASLDTESPKLFSVVDRRIPWLFGGCRSSQEISNIAWAFGKFRIASQKVFSETDQRSKWIFNDGNEQTIANIALAFASTGYPAPNFFDTLQGNIDKISSSSNLQSVANICYALVILDLGKKHPAVLTSLWNLAISAEHDHSEFTMETLMQLVQVQLFAEADGLKLQAPPAELKELMDSIETKEIQSKYQKEVSETLTEIGFVHEEEVSPFDDTVNGGLLAIDMACRKQKVAIEYDGQSHFLRSPATGEMTSIQDGPTRAKKRFLENRGWKVINIDYQDWMEAKRKSETKEWLRSRLVDADVRIEEQDFFAVFQEENISSIKSQAERPTAIKEEAPKPSKGEPSKPDAVFAVSPSFTVSPFFASQTISADDDHPWRALSESTLKRKTVLQLSEYLEDRGCSIIDSNGKKMRKADLIRAVQSLDTSTGSTKQEDHNIQSDGGKSESTVQGAEDDSRIVEASKIARGDVVTNINHPWSDLSKSTLKRKTVVQLSEYLEDRGVGVVDDEGKKLKKAELVVAVFNLSSDNVDKKKKDIDTAASASNHSREGAKSETTPSHNNPWIQLTDSSLKRKTVAQLTEYLVERDAEVKDENGKILRKDKLVAAVRSL